jgi:hypothetical protein
MLDRITSRIAVWMLLFGSLTVLSGTLFIFDGLKRPRSFSIQLIIGTAMVLGGWKYCRIDRMLDVLKNIIALVMLWFGSFVAIFYGMVGLILGDFPLYPIIGFVLGTAIVFGGWKLSPTGRSHIEVM